MDSRLIWLGLVVVVPAVLSACSVYNREYPTKNVIDAGVERYIVQVDDFGTLWSVQKAQAILDRVEELSRTENIHVVLFIHGWHHNAKDSDSNLQDFTSKLTQISEHLNRDVFASLRNQQTGKSPVRVIGIYAGWRGRALPGGLDYLNLWWRKSAAERVGDGDLSEFILRLQRIYLRAEAVSRAGAEAGAPRPMMGLVSLGHSLGGQVLLRSIAEGIEHDLTLRSRRLSDAISTGAVEPTEAVRSDIDSFGDLNILINPAIEAYQYARIDALARQLTYPKDQRPQLVVFSADNDVPRKAFFPIARVLTRPFRPGFRSGTEQGPLWGKALGEYTRQQTHNLNSAPKGAADSLTDQDYLTEEGKKRIRDWDFTSATTFDGISMVPMVNDTRPAYSPTAVVYTHDGLINGHNGFFKKEYWEFLIDYVSFVEGKKLLWRRESAAHPQRTTFMP